MTIDVHTWCNYDMVGHLNSCCMCMHGRRPFHAVAIRYLIFSACKGQHAIGRSGSIYNDWPDKPIDLSYSAVVRYMSGRSTPKHSTPKHGYKLHNTLLQLATPCLILEGCGYRSSPLAHKILAQFKGPQHQHRHQRGQRLDLMQACTSCLRSWWPWDGPRGGR